MISSKTPFEVIALIDGLRAGLFFENNNFFVVLD
jgi:hypothetical protein